MKIKVIRTNNQTEYISSSDAEMDEIRRKYYGKNIWLMLNE